MASFVENFRKAFPNAISKEDAANPFKLVKAVGNVVRDNAQKSRENREAVVNSTFQTKSDGTNYGVGTDGRTYSYAVNNNKIVNFKPVSIEEQKAAINDLTGGNIKIENSIKDPVSLTNIHRSVSRMYNYGNKNLTPDKVNMYDRREKSQFSDGTMGLAWDNTYLEKPDEVELMMTDYPKDIAEQNKKSVEKGRHTGKIYGDIIPTHELSHTAQFAIDEITDRWMSEQEKKAQENYNKYPADKLFKQAISKLFGKDYELTEKDSVGYDIYQKALDKWEKWNEERGGNNGVIMLNNFNKAAKNAGFNNVLEAAASISDYAAERREVYDGDNSYYAEPNLEEIFAEAYTDVLLNEDDAKPFSKELIRLYSDTADEWSRKTGRNKEKNFKEFQEMFSILPDFEVAAQKSPAELFMRHYKTLPKRNK